MVGFGKLSRIFSGSSDADAMMWAWRGGVEFFGVYVGWDFTAMSGGSAVTTVNMRKLFDNKVVTSSMAIATGSVEEVNILSGVTGVLTRAYKSRNSRFNGCLTVIGIPGLTLYSSLFC